MLYEGITMLPSPAFVPGFKIMKQGALPSGRIKPFRTSSRNGTSSIPGTQISLLIAHSYRRNRSATRSWTRLDHMNKRGTQKAEKTKMQSELATIEAMITIV